MADRKLVVDEHAAWADIGSPPQKAKYLQRHNCLPFHLLSDDAFEICCFILLLRERPDARVHYYGKTGDRGRDIVVRHPDGTTEFVQCKRYSDAVGVAEVRHELAKLCVNTFGGLLPDTPDCVTFYIVPDLSSGAQDLLASQAKWQAGAPTWLKDYLKTDPPQDLVDFARGWWPHPDRVAEVALAERANRHPELVDRFFAVQKVVVGSLTEIRPLLDDIRGDIKRLPAEVAKELLPHLGLPAPPPQLTGSQEAVGRHQARVWQGRAERSLDAQGMALWEDIRREVRGLNTVRAIDDGKCLRVWLEGEGTFASAGVRGRVCVLLADLAVIESAVRSLEEKTGATEAREWLARAYDEFGTSPSPEDAARLVYLDARLVWLEGDSEAALAALEGHEDASCRSLSVSVLLTESRDAEAGELARTVPLDDRWCDRLVAAFTGAGLTDEADRVEAWARARPDPVVHQRCLVARVRATVQKQFADRENSRLLLAPLSESDTRVLRELLDDLDPVITPVTARGRLAGGVETQALELTLVIYRLLGLADRWQPVGTLLGLAEPVSLEYARAVCRGDLNDPGTLAARLRADYPRSLFAGHVAAVVDVKNGVTFAEIAWRVEELLPLALRADQAEQLAGLVLERALPEQGTGAVQQAADLAARLLPPEHTLRRAAAHELLRRSGEDAEADALLAAAMDEADPVWLQIAAGREYMRGDHRAALEHLLKAARILGRSETCWHALTLAHQLGEVAAVREMVDLLLRITPDDVRVHRNHADLEFNAGNYKEAVAALQQVERIAPGVIGDAVFLARAAGLAGRNDEAVRVLDRACAGHPTASEPFQLRAILLDSLGKPAVAFESLHAVRERFWEDMGFLGTYHTLAYKVDRDEAGNLALTRIQELQNGDANGPLRFSTLDDLRGFIRARREQHEQLNRAVLNGRLPWSVVGRVLGRESYIDWVVRTQDTLVPDGPAARAEYAVYATNGVSVRTDDGGRLELVSVTAPPRGRAVVADLSALLTLHRLGLLEQALAYFGRVVLPAGFMARFLEDHRSLQPHQLSEVEARRAILTAVDQGRLKSTPVDGQSPLPILDEHHLDEQPADYHLIDAADWLRSIGRLTPAEYARAVLVCHRPAADPAAFRTATARGVRVGVSTLTTAHKVALFGKLISTMKLFIGQREVEELRRDLIGVQTRSEVRGWSIELHSTLTNDTRVETAEPTRPAPHEPDDDRESDPSLDALLLADQRRLPLLADDRCLQNSALLARGGEPGSAFGTDCVVQALAAEGVITSEQHATAWLQLARWRYRFLTPTPGVLLELAARHAEFPPGDDLRQVCRYLHDCLLDHGLHCGMEPTTPPISVGWWYFQTAARAIGRFLMRVWHDPRFDDRAATALTHWCAGEFLPPAPRNLGHAGHAATSQFAGQFVLFGAVSDESFFRDAERSGATLGVMADAFGVSADDYEAVMTTLVEADPELAGEDTRADEAVRHVTAYAVFRDCEGFRFRTAVALADLGLTQRPERPADEDAAAAYADPAHPRRGPIPPGPWVALMRRTPDEENEARYVPELVFHNSQSVRKAALAHLGTAGAGPAPWLTPGTLVTLAAAAPDIGGEDRVAARAAAQAVEAALGQDFFLLIARFRQARALGWREEGDASLRQLFELQTGVLRSIPPATCRLPGGEWPEFLRGLADEPRLEEVLGRYSARYGHLPLAASHAVEAAVGTWTARHGVQGVWDAVWAWASDPSRPLHKYHACRVFLASPGLVPADRHGEVWAVAASLLSWHEAEPAKPALDDQAWRLLHTLARHYQHVQEVEPSPGAAEPSALAWWAAERVTRELVGAASAGRAPDEAARMVRHILTRIARPSGTRSALAAVFGRPARFRSSVAYATENLNSPWCLALLEAGPSPDMTVPAECWEAFYGTLMLAIGSGFPAWDARPDLTPAALEGPFAPVAARWISALSPDDDSEQGRADEIVGVESDPAAAGDEPGEGGSLDLMRQTQETPDLNGLEISVRNLADYEMGEQFFLLQRFRVAVYLGWVDLSAMKWLTDDRVWWDRMFDTLAQERLDNLCSTLIELLRCSEDDDWRLNIPHLFRLQTAREQADVARLQLAADAVLQACVITGNYGSLALMLREPITPALENIFSGLRGRVSSFRRVVPATVQARLRTVLTLLPPEPIGPGRG